MKKISFWLAFMVLIFWGISGLTWAEGPIAVMKPTASNLMPLPKEEAVPTPGALAGQIMLNDTQKRLLSGAGEFAIYGPSKPISRDEIIGMKAKRAARKSSGIPGTSDVLGGGGGGTVGEPRDASIMPTSSQLLNANERIYQEEDQYSFAATQSETSSAVWGSNIVVGFNDAETYFFNPGGNTSFSNWAVSNNGGLSFTTNLDGLPTFAAPGITETDGDPAVDVDASGHFWYSTLAIYTDNSAVKHSAVALYESVDGGNSFGLFTWMYATNPANFLDKDMLVFDRVNGKLYVTVTFFDDITPTVQVLTWNVFDGFLRNPDTNFYGVQGTSPGADHAGNLYVAYEWWDSSGDPYIKVVKSVDHGDTFGAPVAVWSAFVGVDDPTGNAGSFCGRPALKGNIRMEEFPSLAVDTRASGTGAGNIYIAINSRDFAVNPDKGSDILLFRSTTGGSSWSGPVIPYSRLAGDSADKFMPWITVNGNGVLGLIYYDRFPAPYSMSGFVPNWWITTEVKRLNSALGVIDSTRVSPAFPVVVNNDAAVASCYMGDYNSISAQRKAATGAFFAAWGDNRLGDPDVRFAKVVPF